MVSMAFFLLGDSPASEFMCRRFGAICHFLLHRCCKLTPQSNVQNTAKIWNQET